MICHWFPPPEYFFFAEGVPELLYYSHLPTMAIALLLGLFVFINNPKDLKNRLLFIISVFFAVWTVTSLLLWTRIDADFLAFVWTIHVSMFSFIAVYSVYFMYTFLKGSDVSWKVKSVFTTLLIPVLLFGATDLNISGFNIGDCDAFIYEGQIYKGYYIFLALLSMIWILTLVIKYWKETAGKVRTQMILMGIGIEFFLLTFFSLVIMASYLTEFGFFQDSRLELYGLFGMTFFMIVIAVLIVRFKTFNVGAVAANALIIALLILVGSQITFAENTTSLVLTIITLVLTALVGVLLARSVKKEIEQRAELEVLTDRLGKANVKLKQLDKLKSEFVSIASHQLRSPLTSIRGYASMLAEGSFGKLPAKAVEPVDRIAESSRLMAVAVEDYLNVSRIESGNMKYNLSDFNLKEEVEKITDDIRPAAVKKGLMILFRSKLNSKGVAKADIGKTVQIIHNLINNSLKYTPEGSITVLMRDDLKKKRVYVDVIDTGVGMSQETMDRVFEKFERANNANKVNTSGTGLGLFVALSMAKAMKGNISATSEGEGKGSTFTLELPLVQ